MNSAKPMFLAYADAMRAVAVLAVVCIHSAGMSVMLHGQIPASQWWVANIADASCRWAVPVFVMLSGALLLDRARSEHWTLFYHRRLARVGVPLVFWSAFFFWWTAWFHEMDVTPAFVVENIYQGLTYNHLYFLFLILGLYAVTPLLRGYVAETQTSAQWALAAMLLMLAACGIPQDHVPMNAATRFLPFVGYYLMGSLLRDLASTRVRRHVALIALVIATAVIAVSTGLRADLFGIDDYRALLWYDTVSLPVIVQSIAAFLLIREAFYRPSKTKGSTIVRSLGAASFGIYLIHRVPLDLLHGYLHVGATGQVALTIAIEIAVSYLVSAAAAVVLLRVPYVRRLIG